MRTNISIAKEDEKIWNAMPSGMRSKFVSHALNSDLLVQFFTEELTGLLDEIKTDYESLTNKEAKYANKAGKERLPN